MDQIKTKIKKTWLVTVLWLYYFYKILGTAAILSFLIVAIKNNISSAQVNIFDFMVVVILQMLSFIILFYVCLKRKKISLKAVPGLGLFLFLIDFVYSFSLPVPNNLINPVQTFIYSSLFLLITPIVTTSIVYGSRDEFVG